MSSFGKDLIFQTANNTGVVSCSEINNDVATTTRGPTGGRIELLPGVNETDGTNKIRLVNLPNSASGLLSGTIYKESDGTLKVVTIP